MFDFKKAIIFTEEYITNLYSNNYLRMGARAKTAELTTLLAIPETRATSPSTPMCLNLEESNIPCLIYGDCEKPRKQ